MSNENKKAIVEIGDRAARLADARTVVRRDIGAAAPHEAMEMLFRIEGSGYVCDVSKSMLEGIGPDEEDWLFDEEVSTDDGRYYRVRTTEARVARLCGPDPKYRTDEWLRSAARAECETVDDYQSDRVYCLEKEEWNADERAWDFVDSLGGLYGAQAVLDEIGDEDGVVCADGQDILDELEEKRSSAESAA